MNWLAPFNHLKNPMKLTYHLWDIKKNITEFGGRGKNKQLVNGLGLILTSSLKRLTGTGFH